MSAFIMRFGRSRARGKAERWPGPLGSGLPGLVREPVWEGLGMGREGGVNQDAKAISSLPQCPRLYGGVTGLLGEPVIPQVPSTRYSRRLS